MDYIDAELARRRAAAQSTAAEKASNHNPNITNSHDGEEEDQYQDSDSDDQEEPQVKDKAIHKQPAALGKLLEIDLGPDARAKNVAATRAAQRRLDGKEVEEVVDETQRGRRKNGKVRLGPDGKPWRGRKRRGSEDLRRDRTVEQFLRENKREPKPPTTLNLFLPTHPPYLSSQTLSIH